MKATAVAPANIAFIKYWGKSDSKTRIPHNSSISMNLSHVHSKCTVEFDPLLKQDDVGFVGEEIVKPKEIERIIVMLDRVRKFANKKLFALVKTRNNFPKATGIASSASGFAALSLAALTAIGKKLSGKELSIFARLSSGTACRSIPDGFVEWKKGTSSETSYAYELYSPDWWEICDVVVVVSKKMKKVSTTEGHRLADTSPFYQARLAVMNEKISQLKKYMYNRNFSSFGKLIEEDALNMHAICLTSTPALIYWEPKTIEIMKQIIEWRESKEVESYFTIDAGPSVHVICEKKNVNQIQEKLKDVSGIQQVIVNSSSIGARLSDKHLF